MTDSNPDDLWQRTLQSVHDEAVDAIITIDARGTIETVNPATEAMFGYSPAELIGNNVKMLMPAPYREEHDGYLRKYHETGQREIIGIGREVVAQTKLGRVFPIHLAVSEVRVGQQRKYAGFIRDLSNLKRVQEQEAALGRIIEDSLNEVFIFHAETLRFIQVNHGARENLGYLPEELKELTPVDIKPNFSDDQFRDVLQPLLTGELEKLSFNTIHERKDGTRYHVEVNLQLSTFQSMPVFVAIILDVTQRVEAEQKVQLQREAMQAELVQLVETRTTELHATQAELVRSEKFSTLGKVSGGIAHEIRNPLNAVKTSAYYLLNAKQPTPEKTREHLERIDRQVSLIDNVVTALSDVAKLPEANLVPIAMARILKELAKAVDLPSNIAIVFELPDDLPDVLADENQIVIAFNNLVRNARDAMPDGGTLTLAAIVDDDCVCFTVQDTGTGISPENLTKVLEPLFTTKARGMGLGLSIASTIAEKNKGTLSVTSKPTEGSRFSIQLQRAK